MIPLSNDFNKYGEIINVNHITRDGLFGILYSYTEDIEIFIYNHYNNKYNGIVYKRGFEYLKFTDLEVYDNPNYNLIRKFGNNSIFIKDGLIIHMDTIIKSKKVKQGKRKLINNKKYLTFDIECYLDENVNNNKKKDEKRWDFIPYACGWYSKNEYKIYMVTAWEEMILQFFTDIENKFKNYTIYIHNFSSFDSLYMLKILYKKYRINPLFKDGKVISLNLSSKNRKNK